jgi:predicted Zn-dependent peptidase
LAGGAVTWRQEASVVSAEARAVTLTLDNGLRARIIANDSRYIAAALVLRSSDIRAADGLAHILEHTSFVGAAGAFSANLIKQMHQDYIQESNASTEPGMMQWQVSFLPKYLEQVLGLLAVISLDQQCDVETVRREARVVLQELYLDRYHHSFRHKRLLGGALFGSDHPYGIEVLWRFPIRPGADAVSAACPGHSNSPGLYRLVAGATPSPVENQNCMEYWHWGHAY